MREWFSYKPEESVVVIWADNTHPSGIGMEVLGQPKREFIDHDGFMLSRLPERKESADLPLSDKPPER
jgi:hypothetical protein